MCYTEEEEEEEEEKRDFFLHLLLLYLSLAASWKLLMQLDLVSVCVPGFPQPSLSVSPLLSTSPPPPLFTALLGSPLHCNWTIMQPVWSTTTTLHDSATTIVLLRQTHY